MTREEIETLAGRTLDAHVAEHVMGIPALSQRHHGDLVLWHEHAGLGRAYTVSVPKYSTDIRAAWSVLNALVARHPPPPEDNSLALHFCRCVNGPLWECHFGWGRGGPSGSGETAPLAICRAALLDALAPA